MKLDLFSLLSVLICFPSLFVQQIIHLIQRKCFSLNNFLVNNFLFFHSFWIIFWVSLKKVKLVYKFYSCWLWFWFCFVALIFIINCCGTFCIFFSLNLRNFPWWTTLCYMCAFYMLAIYKHQSCHWFINVSTNSVSFWGRTAIYVSNIREEWGLRGFLRGFLFDYFCVDSGSEITELICLMICFHRLSLRLVKWHDIGFSCYAGFLVSFCLQRTLVLSSVDLFCTDGQHQCMWNMWFHPLWTLL